MLSDFRGRNVSRFSVPKSSDEKIILPFVSAGVTWIDESTQQDRDNEVAESGDEGEDENNEGDDEEEEEEEELVLSLPQFTTPQYINDRPDTALITFEAGAARLARGGEGQEDDEPELEDEECRWRLLIASNKKQADSGDEDWAKKWAGNTISLLNNWHLAARQPFLLLFSMSVEEYEWWDDNLEEEWSVQSLMVCNNRGIAYSTTTTTL